MFKFSAHTPFFAIVSIESAQLLFRLEWKPALPAVQTNTLGSIVSDKAEYRTKWTKYTRNQQRSEEGKARLVIDVSLPRTSRTTAVYTRSTCPTVITMVSSLGNGLTADPADSILIACFINFCHSPIQHLKL